MKNLLVVLLIGAVLPAFAQSKVNSNTADKKSTTVKESEARKAEVQENTQKLTPEQKAALVKKKEVQGNQQKTKVVPANKGAVTNKGAKKVTPAPKPADNKTGKVVPTNKGQAQVKKTTPSGNKPGFKATPVNTTPKATGNKTKPVVETNKKPTVQPKKVIKPTNNNKPAEKSAVVKPSTKTAVKSASGK